MVLVPDPHGGDPNAFGSYLVFRKLEQNIREFARAKQILADELGLSDTSVAGALMIGRFEDGTPIVHGVVPGTNGAVPTNNFNFESDRSGASCPFQAHIRKINPRGTGQGAIDVEAKHRIVRRGIPYGEKVPVGQDIDALPSAGRGLLFMCYQQSIRNQFEFLQSQWASKEDFPTVGSGIDPIIGQLETPQAQRWPTKIATTNAPTKEVLMRGFVTLRGGEYFFSPSISFLSRIESILPVQ